MKDIGSKIHAFGKALIDSAQFSQTLGLFSYNMSVLGGVIAGLITVALHNRFYTVVLPTVPASSAAGALSPS